MNDATLKTELRKVYLLNWYGFVDVTVPIGPNMTLITGENESGKSTILDAVKYAFTGDTQFNKSAESSGGSARGRTIDGYTRCLVNGDSGEFARPASKYPTLYSHIALEFHSQERNADYVLGVIIETNSSNSTTSYWYTLDNRKIEDIQFCAEKNGAKYSLSEREFKAVNHAVTERQQDGIEKFMAMNKLRLKGKAILQFQRKLRNMTTYNPKSKIQKFIKESVMEEKKIDISKIQNAQKELDKTKQIFQNIQAEKHDLEAVLDAHKKYKNVSDRQKCNEIKTAYKKLCSDQDKLFATQSDIADISNQLTNSENSRQNLEKEKIDVTQQHNEAVDQRNKLDGNNAVQSEETNLASLKQALAEFSHKKSDLKILGNSINAFSSKASMNAEACDYLDPSIDESVKISNLSEVQLAFSQISSKLEKQSQKLQENFESVNAEISACEKKIASYSHNQIDYSVLNEQQSLIKEINAKFNELHIDSQAHLACYYVEELTDESWRDAIECFLGPHRYSVLVDPEYFEIANDVFDHSKHRQVELVNTKLLRSKTFKVEDDSLIHKLVIHEDTARMYFEYWLGKIHAVDLSEVANYELAMSKESKISRNMAVTYLNFNRLKSYYLGGNALEINKRNAEHQLSRLIASRQLLGEDIQKLNSILKSRNNLNSLLYKGDYDFTAPVKYLECQKKIADSENRLAQLKHSLKHNQDFMLLDDRMKELEHQLSKIHNSINSTEQRISALKGRKEQLANSIPSIEAEIKISDSKMKKYESESSALADQAKNEYDRFRNGESSKGDVPTADSQAKTEKLMRATMDAFADAKARYNNSKYTERPLALTENSDDISSYEKRLRKIDIDDLVKLQSSLDDRKRRFEDIFASEFVLQIQNYVDDELAEFKALNKVLASVKFQKLYQFSVHPVKGDSDYAKILDYADYLKKSNRIENGKVTAGSLFDCDSEERLQHEAEIKDIVHKIIDDSDSSKQQIIDDLSDYRNYMSYELLETTENMKSAAYSKVASYASGGGNQVPFTIILAAALIRVYNSCPYCARLVFMDEPFGKLDDTNIKSMLDFFKANNLQVIFCAPPSRLESIGKYCDSISGVLKDQKTSSMQVAWENFHE